MPIASGYHRDADCILYVTKGGFCYLVTEPGKDEPVWRKLDGPVDECLSPDAEPTKLGIEDMATFERCRADRGIPE